VWILARGKAACASKACTCASTKGSSDYVAFPSDEAQEAMAQASLRLARKSAKRQREACMPIVNPQKPNTHAPPKKKKHKAHGQDEKPSPSHPAAGCGDHSTLRLSRLVDGDLGIGRCGRLHQRRRSAAEWCNPTTLQGSYGLFVPNGEPYRVWAHALREVARSFESLRPMAGRDSSPYLRVHAGSPQARYTPHEIREQIRAAEELVIESPGCVVSPVVYHSRLAGALSHITTVTRWRP